MGRDQIDHEEMIKDYWNWRKKRDIALQNLNSKTNFPNTSHNSQKTEGDK